MNYDMLLLIISIIFLIILITYNTFINPKTEKYQSINPHMNIIDSNNNSDNDTIIVTRKSTGEITNTNIYNMFYPSKTILMWNNKEKNDEPPSGWVLCDGKNGTPDMSLKFPMGYDATNSKYNILGPSTLGEISHTLTFEEIPSHSHIYRKVFNNDSPITGVSSTITTQNKAYDVIKDLGISTTDINFPNNQSHNNMPPYIVLKFIMKL